MWCTYGCGSKCMASCYLKRLCRIAPRSIWRLCNWFKSNHFISTRYRCLLPHGYCFFFSSGQPKINTTHTCAILRWTFVYVTPCLSLSITYFVMPIAHADRLPLIAYRILLSAYRLWLIAFCLLRIAYYSLAITYCLLPVGCDYGLLPVAYRLLTTAYMT